MHPVLASPVGGELKGGLIMNEYEEITAGLRLQNEVTMVTKAERKSTAPTGLQGLVSFIPELCWALHDSFAGLTASQGRGNKSASLFLASSAFTGWGGLARVWKESGF